MTAHPLAVPGGRELGLAAQVAAALLADAERTDGAFEARLGDLAAAPHFRGPLRRGAARAIGLADLPLDPGFTGRLRDRPETRFCALLVGQPSTAVRAAALCIAAAVFHRRLIGVVLKSDRDRLRSMLGDEAFAVATQEALLLDAPLVQLGDGEAPLDIADAVTLPGRLMSVGAALLVRFTALMEPALAVVVAHRLPEAAGAAAGGARLMAERHCIPVIKLLRRRGPGWATLIA